METTVPLPSGQALSTALSTDSEVAMKLVHSPGGFLHHLQTDLTSEELGAGCGNITEVHLVRDMEPSLWGLCALWRTGVSIQAT